MWARDFYYLVVFGSKIEILILIAFSNTLESTVGNWSHQFHTFFMYVYLYFKQFWKGTVFK